MIYTIQKHYITFKIFHFWYTASIARAILITQSQVMVIGFSISWCECWSRFIIFGVPCLLNDLWGRSTQVVYFSLWVKDLLRHLFFGVGCCPLVINLLNSMTRQVCSTIKSWVCRHFIKWVRPDVFFSINKGLARHVEFLIVPFIGCQTDL